MPDDANDLRARIVQEWTDAAAGWRRWEPHIIAFSWPMTHRLVDALCLSGGEHVLDVGCGFGDPAGAIAQRIGPTGRLIAIDPVAEMVDTARSRLSRLGLDHVDFRVAGVEEVEIPQSSLDAVCGRWSFIFCPDPVGALRRARSWLKPGGRLALSTWTPMPNNPGFHAINQALNRQVELPPIDSTKPGMLQLAEPGQLENALAAAGFRDVRVDEVRLSIFARDGRDFWDMMSGIGGSLARVIRTLTPTQQNDVRNDVAEAVSTHRDADVLRIPALAQVGSAIA